jgi:catechol 2,3-dioxygenase-like lactoylglutathione lyase family enzyme
MLGSCSIIAFTATADPPRAREFYEDTLGLDLVSDEPHALVFDAGGIMLRIQKVEHVAPPPYTALGWQVDDIESAVRQLMRNGVHFERYEGLEQDDLCIWSSGHARIAWFKDPDGNLLSLTGP